MILTPCLDAAPEGSLGIIDLSIAPPLLLYSHVPIAILSILFGLLVFVKDRRSFQSQYFLGMAFSFSLWVLIALIQWIGVHLEVVLFAWQIILLPEIALYSFAILFIYAFLFEKQIPKILSRSFLGLLILVALVMPTQWNVQSFDLPNCEGAFGIVWRPITYYFELICLITIIAIAITSLAQGGKKERIKSIMSTAGLIFFLGLFWASNYLGEMTQVYEINLIGPAGMTVLLGALSYMMMKFQVFNMKLIAAQLLIVAILFFVVSLLFIQNIDVIHIIILFTFGLVSMLGAMLIRGVQREIEQREKIEKLAGTLEVTNSQLKELDRQKDGVLHMVAHQLKGPVTGINYMTELFLDGTYGELTKDQKEGIETIREASQKMGVQSEMVLDSAKITAGKLPLEPEPVDLNKLIKAIVSEAETHAREKKVQLKVMLPTSPLPTAVLDRKYTQLALDNLLSNAIKYTGVKGPGGKVEFAVEVKNEKLSCSVKDTGIGIPKKDQEHIFKELYRASNAGREGHGLGLHVAMGAIEAQGGKMRFESTEGKGTTFFIDLPIVPA